MSQPMVPTSFRSVLFIIACFLVSVLLVGCEEEEDILALPTRFVPPTETVTPIPSATPIPAHTEYPTWTPSMTFTPSLVPTETVQAIFTATPVDTPTDTPIPPSPTLPPTWTPWPTETPPVTPTLALPSIRTFTASTYTVNTGESLTLVWQSINADAAQLEQMDANQIVIQTFSVTPNGQLPVTMPSTGGNVIYRLTVFQQGRLDTRSLLIQVGQTCPSEWAMSVPDDAGCPFGMPTSFVGKFQQFERGIMFNVYVSGEDRVYGLVNVPQQRYMVYPNTWDGTTGLTSACGNAPAGLVGPRGVFRWMYHTQLGPQGTWCDPNFGIGWALAPPNNDIVLTYQFVSTGMAFYIQIPGYGTVYISNEPGISGSWKLVGP
jgi:hypothetical protein